MPRGVKKENLPTKICVVCERPFNWRKKWERCWDEVTTCSKSCNRKRRETARKATNASTTLAKEPSEQNTIESDDSFSSNDFGENEIFEMIRSELRLDPDIDASADEAETDVHFTSMTKAGSDTNSQDDNSSDERYAENSCDDPRARVIAGPEVNRGDDTSSDAEHTENGHPLEDPKAKAKAERKAAKKAKKAALRAQREGRGEPTAGQKPCDMCGKSVNLLIRCTYDASGEWKMVCGKCWNVASGGVIDGDTQHPHYRYGGLWKNRRVR